MLLSNCYALYEAFNKIKIKYKQFQKIICVLIIFQIVLINILIISYNIR